VGLWKRITLKGAGAVDSRHKERGKEKSREEGRCRTDQLLGTKKGWEGTDQNTAGTGDVKGRSPTKCGRNWRRNAAALEIIGGGNPEDDSNKWGTALKNRGKLGTIRFQ